MTPSPLPQTNFIEFLGTAGARYVTISQTRASGGIWISFEGTNLLIDPGPGSLIKCLEAVPKLEPSTLDGIIVTHKHIDHCNDINIMIEAMTLGGSKKKGKVFVPQDMLDEDSMLRKYACALPEEIISLKENGDYTLGSISFSTPLRHVHPVETYGLKFRFKERTVSFVADARYSDTMASCYKGDILILNTVLVQPFEHVDHLNIKDAGRLIADIRPQKAILTHFGRELLNKGPETFARQLTGETGIEVIAATDGMMVGL
ncbi:MAG TPA: MBL fold metallo-hydrolase [Candidatus Omnitrophota bacterium]|nr:MBL fold metallo-hydrolase [Candidatus Omnitrophota bacterium]HPD84215.1 MBL fold metallo-hydrolase [Candidatus Omnitrophota bacterium]HRZ03071.1 MBL fold metallo-hydrolase [Candidatus Omnitrophota bacterium]